MSNATSPHSASTSYTSARKRRLATAQQHGSRAYAEGQPPPSPSLVTSHYSYPAPRDHIDCHRPYALASHDLRSEESSSVSLQSHQEVFALPLGTSPGPREGIILPIFATEISSAGSVGGGTSSLVFSSFTSLKDLRIWIR